MERMVIPSGIGDDLHKETVQTDLLNRRQALALLVCAAGVGGVAGYRESPSESFEENIKPEVIASKAIDMGEVFKCEQSVIAQRDPEGNVTSRQHGGLSIMRRDGDSDGSGTELVVSRTADERDIVCEVRDVDDKGRKFFMLTDGVFGYSHANELAVTLDVLSSDQKWTERIAPLIKQYGSLSGVLASYNDFSDSEGQTDFNIALLLRLRAELGKMVDQSRMAAK